MDINRLAFVAFPLALHVLNTHLSASAARQSSSREDALVEAMRSLQVQYDGVDFVVKVIRQLIELVQDDAASTAVTDWSELLTVRPRTYLRMSLAMDMSMSSGRFHDKERVLARLHDLERSSSNIASEVLLYQPQPQQEQEDEIPSLQSTTTTNPQDLQHITNSICDDFSSFKESVDMTALFDANCLVDFGLGAGSAVTGMDESQHIRTQQY